MTIHEMWRQTDATREDERQNVIALLVAAQGVIYDLADNPPENVRRLATAARALTGINYLAESSPMA